MSRKAKLLFVTKVLSVMLGASMLSMSALLSAGTVDYQVDTQVQIGQRISSTSNGLVTLGKTDNSTYLISGQYQVNDIAKDTSWIASIGTGYRHLITQNMMIGGYLFTDMLKDHDGNDYYMLSPGLEFKTQQWSLVSNAYVPIGKREHKKEVSAEDLGYAANFVGSGNTAAVDYYKTYDHLMMGFDMMLSYEPKWLLGLSMGLGSYHYQAKASDVREDVSYTGIKTQVGYDIGKYVNVQAGYRYDKENKSRYMVALGINFHSRTKESTLAQTLIQPIQRHQNINTTKSGIAVNTQKELSRKTITGVHYASGTGSASAPCTYENQCNSVIDAITVASSKDGNKTVWLEGGHRYDLTNKFTLNEGVQLIGRSAGFASAINGQDIGAPWIRITPENDGAGIMMENGSYLEGIWLDTVGNKQLSTWTNPNQFNYAIFLNDSTGSVGLKNMKITSGLKQSGLRRVVGILNNGGIIAITGSNEIIAIDMQGSGDNAYGIYNFANDSTISFSGPGEQIITAIKKGEGYVAGIMNSGENSTITFSGNGNQTITATSEENATPFGIRNYDVNSSTIFSGDGNQVINVTMVQDSDRAMGIQNFADNSSTIFSGDGDQAIYVTSTTKDLGYVEAIANYGENTLTNFSGAGEHKIKATVFGYGSATGVLNLKDSSSLLLNKRGTTHIHVKVESASNASEVYGIHNKGIVNFNQSAVIISVNSLGNSQTANNIKHYKKLGSGTVSGSDNVSCFKGGNTESCNLN